MAVLVAVAVVTMSLMVAVLGSLMLFFLLTVALAVPRVAVVFLVPFVSVVTFVSAVA